MTQETIDKITSLIKLKEITDSNLKSIALITDNLKYASNKRAVIETFIYLATNSGTNFNSVNLDPLWDTVYSTIVIEWDKVRKAEEAKLDNINRQLKEL